MSQATFTPTELQKLIASRGKQVSIPISEIPNLTIDTFTTVYAAWKYSKEPEDLQKSTIAKLVESLRYSHINGDNYLQKYFRDHMFDRNDYSRSWEKNRILEADCISLGPDETCAKQSIMGLLSGASAVLLRDAEIMGRTAEGYSAAESGSPKTLEVLLNRYFSTDKGLTQLYDEKTKDTAGEPLTDGGSTSKDVTSTQVSSQDQHEQETAKGEEPKVDEWVESVVKALNDVGLEET